MIKFAAHLCFGFVMLCAVSSGQAALYTVTKIADTNDGMCDADCSLREAIAAANTTVDNDSITFALPLFSSPQTITLSGSELVVANNGSLTIFGTGANRLTISGNNASRILASGANVVVNLHNLRFTGGNGVGAVNTGRGGAVYNVGGTMLVTNSIFTGNSAANGGAMNNAASSGPAVNANLTIVNCMLSNNSSTSSGAALQNFSTSTLHIRDSTINNNNSTGTGITGAFQANGTVTITNSTFSGNTTAGTGGAIYYNGGGLVMTNVTIAGNTSATGSGGFHKATTTANANVRNSIMSGNSTADAAGLVVSQGNNIVQVVGTSTGWIPSDMNVDPLLAPLGFYGGLTMTRFLLSGSPAINGGQNCVTDASCSAANPPVPVNTDERGVARPFGASVDIGAVEASGSYYATVPSATAAAPYNFTLVPANGSFTYSVNSGSFGGLMLTSSTSTTLTGTAPVPGIFDALIHMIGPSGQAFHNYRINVLADPTVVSVSGRVLTSAGEQVSKALVTFTGLNGQTYTTLTSPFGYYLINNIPAGLTGTITVGGKKGLTFAPQQITAVDVIENLDLRAQPIS